MLKVRKAFLLLLLVFGILLGLAKSPKGPDTTQPQEFPLKSGQDPLLKIDVFYVPEGKVYSMDLEEYVKCVVASEMPASFHEEALKAQAVLARTYAVRKMKVLGGTPLSSTADVSSDPTVDQAWNPPEVIRAKWGLVMSWINWQKISRAVDETRGMILTYDGMPCEVFYHSTCGGQTEAAKDVWGKDIPYLQSVPCTYCQKSPYFSKQTVSLSSTQVSQALSKLLGTTIPVSKVVQKGVISVASVSPTGRVKEVLVQGQKVRGLEFRMALGLKSTKFTMVSSGDKLVFQVQGYGHGVGMCQYGADGMARDGKTWKDILSYYFPGTDVRFIFEE